MKIAIPVKLNRDNPPVAPLFGKAKWFALVENGQVKIKANPQQGGKAVIQWLLEENVDTIIMQEMGRSPYQMIHSHGGIKLYHSGYERILIDDLIKKFENNVLTKLNDTNMQQVIKHHEKKHPQHHHHSHGYHTGAYPHDHNQHGNGHTC